MAEIFSSENPLLHRELVSEIPKRKLPLRVEVNGQEIEVVVEYGIAAEKIVGICGECKKENSTLFREKVSGEVQAGSDDASVVQIAQEKVRALVDGVENEMLCCEGCFTNEFIQKRPEKYIKAMQTVSEGLGITIDIQRLKEAIVGS